MGRSTSVMATATATAKRRIHRRRTASTNQTEPAAYASG
jgi:hypothetical protein